MKINQRASGIVPGLFSRAEAIASGFGDRKLRSPEFRRILHGIYCLSSMEVTHKLRCQGLALKLPSTAVVTGISAATVHGVPLARPFDPIDVLARGCKRLHGVRNFATRHRPWDSVPWSGIRLATLKRATMDMMIHNPLPKAVGLADQVIRSGLLSISALKEFIERRADWRVKKARKALALLDDRSESVPESMIRVMLLLRGIQAEPQFHVPGPRGEAFRLDLALSKLKLGIEYNGGWHADPLQSKYDDLRRDWLSSEGWKILTFTSSDLHEGENHIVSCVREAIQTKKSQR